MNKSVLTILMMVLLAACTTQDKKKMLQGKWQAVALDNPAQDSVLAEQRAFLDTFGNSTTDEQNMEIYGFTNVDSARHEVKKVLDDYMSMQDEAIKNTRFDFRKDGTMITEFKGVVDSANWGINDEGMLEFEQMTSEGTPQKLSMEILYVTDTLLKLRMTENGMSSTVIFEPVDK